MSINDPDGGPFEMRTFERCIEVLMSTGWTRKAAEEEWERFDKEDGLVDIRELTW